jgi:hypothetical protein
MASPLPEIEEYRKPEEILLSVLMMIVPLGIFS